MNSIWSLQIKEASKWTVFQKILVNWNYFMKAFWIIAKSWNMQRRITKNEYCFTFNLRIKFCCWKLFLTATFLFDLIQYGLIYLIWILKSFWIKKYALATSRIFWAKINIFFNLYSKRFSMFLRSFSYQTFGRRWSFT